MALYALLYCLFGIDNNTIENFIISMMTNLIVLIATVFILDRVFSNYHEKINEKKELKLYLDVLGGHHRDLVYDLERFIITFITKEPAEYRIENNIEKHIVELDELKANINETVKKGFFTKKYIVTEVDRNTLVDYRDIHITHTEFMLENKQKISAKISNHIILYSKIIPTESLKDFISIKKYLNTSAVFIIPQQSGLNISMENMTHEEDALKRYRSDVIQFIDMIQKLKKNIE